MKKGQSATEFVVLATLMFLLFSLSFIYIESLLVDYTRDTQQAQVVAIQSNIQKELDLAKNMPDGYQRKFSLPTSINGNSYSMTIQAETAPAKDSIIISYKGGETILFVDQDISGTLIAGENILRKNPNLVFN